MKRTIRLGVWETNSSSVHSICICTQEDYDKWVNGELFYDTDKQQLTPAKINRWDEKTLTSEEYEEEYEWFDLFEEHFISPSGDKMVAFGYYGHD